MTGPEDSDKRGRNAAGSGRAVGAGDRGNVNRGTTTPERSTGSNPPTTDNRRQTGAGAVSEEIIPRRNTYIFKDSPLPDLTREFGEVRRARNRKNDTDDTPPVGLDSLLRDYDSTTNKPVEARNPKAKGRPEGPGATETPEEESGGAPTAPDEPPKPKAHPRPQAAISPDYPDLFASLEELEKRASSRVEEARQDHIKIVTIRAQFAHAMSWFGDAARHYCDAAEISASPGPWRSAAKLFPQVRSARTKPALAQRIAALAPKSFKHDGCVGLLLQSGVVDSLIEAGSQMEAEEIMMALVEHCREVPAEQPADVADKLRDIAQRFENAFPASPVLQKVREAFLGPHAVPHS